MPRMRPGTPTPASRGGEGGEGLRLRVASLGVTGYLGSFLYGIKPTDPVTFGAVAIFLVLLAIAASYFPTRRAMCVEPIVALRHE